MIVEVTGPTGVGKSFFIKKLLHALNEVGNETGAILTATDNQCKEIPGCFSHLEKHNIKTDILALPYFLIFIFNYPLFFWFIFWRIIRDGYSVNEKISKLRSFVRKAGIYRFLRSKRFVNKIIIVDEGLFHISHNILCSPNHCATSEEIQKFVMLCPPADKLIVLISSQNKILEQLKRRGNISPRVRDIESLKSFVHFSRQLYERITNLGSLLGFGLNLNLESMSEKDLILLSANYIRG